MLKQRTIVENVDINIGGCCPKDLQKTISELTALSDQQKMRIQELEGLCGEAYQVVGYLADALGCFDAPGVTKALDNLSSASEVHKDLLPFSVEEKKPWTWEQARRFCLQRDIHFPVEAAHRAVEQFCKEKK